MPAWWEKLEPGVDLIRPAQTYPLAANTNMFTANGKILLTSIVGEVQVDAIDGACGNCSITTETADIATAVAITADVVGQRYSVATIGGALIVADPHADLYQPIIIPDAADISLTITAAATTNGEIMWTIRYFPMTAGAYVSLA